MRQWRNELFVKRERNRLVARQRQRLTRLMCVSVFVEHKQSTGCHMPHTRTRLNYTHCVRRTRSAHMKYCCFCSHVNIAFVFESPSRHTNTHSMAAQTQARIHRFETTLSRMNAAIHSVYVGGRRYSTWMYARTNAYMFVCFATNSRFV